MLYSECSLDCGDDGGRCLKTEIPGLPEICACPDGIYTNSTCAEEDDEEEQHETNMTSINDHGW
jgi:hypothetical protein